MTQAARPLKIFVVDDHRDVAEGLADVLRMHGHEVEVAFNGEQAIRIFRERDFDIAFMDVMMPGMNGVESFMEIRKIKPAAKVIMMTGYSVAQLLDQAIDKGAYGVLHKPVSVDDVLEALNRVNSQGMVLVADDDPDFSAAIKEVIEQNGYRVCLASSGSEALKTVMGGGVDILVLDLHLPVISGLEVYMQLQKRNRAIPTVVVTGYSDEQSEAISTLQSVSKTGILTKPFDSTQLLWELGKLSPSKAALEEDGDKAETAIETPGGGQMPDTTADQERAASESAPGDAAPTPEPETIAAEPIPDEPEPSGQTVEAAPLEEPVAPQQLTEPVSEEAPAEPAVPASAPVAEEPAAELQLAQPEPEPEMRPAASEPAGIPDPVQEEPAAQPCPGRILIVDDDIDMVEGLAEVVRTWGYEVETANTPDQATEIIERFDAQAALLDIRLGKHNGLDLIPILKEHRPSIYCVMITGNADKESSIEAMRRGAHDYLIKPLDPDQVSAILERCLDRYNVEQRLNAAFDEIQDAKNAAERTSEGTSQLVTRMSQELTRPVEAIVEAAKALRVKAIAGGHADYLAETGSIEAAAAGIQELLGNSLYLAKAQSDELELHEGKVTFIELASAAVAEARQLIDQAGPEVKVELPDDPLVLWGDGDLLRRALVNLLTNAFKFTLETGSIILKAETANDGCAAIVVQDTGVGMDPASIPSALSQFGRVEDENCTGLQGAGLGLPLVAALVERHGGTMTLVSEKGKGTTATITLPAGRRVEAKTAA